MHKALFNGSENPVVVDGEGRQVEPGEWGVGDSTYDPLKDAVTAGTVSWLTGKVDKDSNPDAVAAAAKADEMNAAAKTTTEA